MTAKRTLKETKRRNNSINKYDNLFVEFTRIDVSLWIDVVVVSLMVDIDSCYGRSRRVAAR